MTWVAFPLVALAVLSLCYGMADAASTPPQPKLQWHYYKIHNTCRYVEEYVRHEVKLYWAKDKSTTPKLARLAYADCFVAVCLCPTSFFLSYFGTSYYNFLPSF